MTKPKELFPILNEPSWLVEREKDWEVAVAVGELKSDLRKKELNKLKHYFFTGELGNENPYEEYEGALFKMFPMQSNEGYSYLYKSKSYSIEFLKGLTFDALIDQSHNGHRESSQIAFWDYHLGKTFQPTVTRETKDGPISIELDAREIVSNIIGYLVLHLGSGSYSQNPKWFVNLPYLFSAIEYAEDTLFRDEPILAFKWLFLDVLAIRHGTYTGELNAYAIDFANNFMEFMNSSKKIVKELLKLFRKIESESKV
jgi:hypothetical protein